MCVRERAVTPSLPPLSPLLYEVERSIREGGEKGVSDRRKKKDLPREGLQRDGIGSHLKGGGGGGDGRGRGKGDLHRWFGRQRVCGGGGLPLEGCVFTVSLSRPLSLLSFFIVVLLFALYLCLSFAFSSCLRIFRRFMPYLSIYRCGYF